MLLALLLFANTLSLQEAVRTALKNHPTLDSASARVRAAEARVSQARGAWLPKVEYTESFTRSNNPVFVFGTLLSQHRFREANFDVELLNKPDALDNFQSRVTADYLVFDAGASRAAIRAATLGRDVSAEMERSARMHVIAGVVRAYLGAALAAEALSAAAEALRSAEADLERAKTVRSAGMSTDADVLSIRVHLASMREAHIRRRHQEEVARAALNDALGLPLDSPLELDTKLPAPVATTPPDAETALTSRPEVRQARLAEQIAEANATSARANMLPQVFVRGVFEADRERFVTRGASNWLFEAGLRWTVFHGGIDKARMTEAGHAYRAATADARRAQSAIGLEIREAVSNLAAAGERIAAAEAAAGEAEESLRIIKNRFEAGLSTVTDLLRAETALLDARTRRIAAIHDQRMAAVNVQLAAGTLTENSEVLK